MLFEGEDEGEGTNSPVLGDSGDLFSDEAGAAAAANCSVAPSAKVLTDELDSAAEIACGLPAWRFALWTLSNDALYKFLKSSSLYFVLTPNNFFWLIVFLYKSSLVVSSSILSLIILVFDLALGLALDLALVFTLELCC